MDLMTWLLAAGCVNHAAAIALVLGRQDVTEGVEEGHPAAWEELQTLIANDVHLCAFAPLLSPPATPLMLMQGR
jgi:hypothetical protein